MSASDRRQHLINQIVKFSHLLKEGRYEEIDLSTIEKEAADLAANFYSIVQSLEEVGYKIIDDKEDVRQISDHLKHISKTTEEGVMKVMDHSEAIVTDATDISEQLATLREKLKGNPDLLALTETIEEKLTHLQDNAFTIMTSLEFEDINRQKLEKILKKHNQLHDNLIHVLLLLKIRDKIEKKDSSFIREISQISDPNHDSAGKQDMIDELLQEFGL